jgi:hypothetical protein
MRINHFVMNVENGFYDGQNDKVIVTGAFINQNL